MKALFIDRDGTMIVEPPVTEQVDTLDQLQFMPDALWAMRSIRALPFELVLASNQDGLGTESYPRERFDRVHGKFLQTLAGEGVCFDDQLIDGHFPGDNHPDRKPGTGMFRKYLTGGYDLAGSYVIGDRLTDVQLALNLGCKAILYRPASTGEEMLATRPELAGSCALITDKWTEIAEYLRRGCRRATINRTTRETDIHITADLDGGMQSSISTGLHFFDHMLDQIAHHSGIALQIRAKGDLEVDAHHTMEDTAIALGEALHAALGDKRGLERYGFALPMDECRARVLIDLGGRIDFDWDVSFTVEKVGDVPTEMFKHFFKSLCAALRCNLHIAARGENNHHLAEAVFKAFARALRMAVRKDVYSDVLPSSKGELW